MASTGKSKGLAQKANGSTVNAGQLQGFLESLEMVRDEACGYGELMSAEIQSVFDGTVVTATYFDGEWSIRVG